MNIKWGISQIKRTEVDKVALLVDWFCETRDNTFLEVEYGQVQLKPKEPSAAGFIPFDNLTEQEVLDWIFAYVNKAQIETQLVAVIEARKTPTLIADIPWQNPTGE
jgi:hypothetical protein